MKINTKAFGEIDIDEDKILRFEKGIIGFPDLNRFILLHDEEEGSSAGIRWLQSVDEPGFAMPVMDPLFVIPDYDPEVEDEWLKDLELNQNNLLVMVTVTIPSDLTRMSVNLQGPIIINAEKYKGCQVIVNSDSYLVKFPIYDILKARKDGEQDAGVIQEKR